MRRVPTVPLVMLLVLAIVPQWSGEARRPILGARATMTATQVALDPADTARRRVGRLTYLGGVLLRSRDPAFGGFSSMIVTRDRFTLLSDGGTIVQFRMGADWRPADIGFGDLPDGPGRGWSKRDRDSESMAIDPATGTIWVGFEGYNAIWRYAPGFAAPTGAVRARLMRDWPENGGPESMARLRDGRFVVIGETARPPRIAGERQPGRRGIVFARDPVAGADRAFGFVYLPPAGFDPTDATQLPDGQLLVLNRAFGPPFVFSSSLVLVDPRAIRRGATVRGVEIARLEPPLIHDNFEGVATTREAGRTIVWIVSDDNQTVLQRTLLLKFVLDR